MDETGTIRPSAGRRPKAGTAAAGPDTKAAPPAVRTRTAVKAAVPVAKAAKTPARRTTTAVAASKAPVIAVKATAAKATAAKATAAKGTAAKATPAKAMPATGTKAPARRTPPSAVATPAPTPAKRPSVRASASRPGPVPPTAVAEAGPDPDWLPAPAPEVTQADEAQPDLLRPVWTPPRRKPGGDSRPNASSVIADLWSEREGPRPTTPVPGSTPVGSIAPPSTALPLTVPPRSGKGGLIAAIVAVGVLLGGGVGVFLATSGVGLPSKAKFIAKADAICGQANAPLASLARPTSYPELTTAVGSVVTATDAQVAALQKVKVPGGAGGDGAKAFVGALASAGTAVHGLQTAAAGKDDAATARATTQVSSQFSDASAQAKAYGLKACGSGMQTSMDNLVGGTKTLVKTGFVAKADNLCREASRNFDAIPVPRTNNLRDIARAFTSLLAVANKLTNDLKVLPVPPGDEADVSAMLGAQDKVNTKFTEMRDALSSNDPQRFNAAEAEVSMLETAANAKFDAYGLGVCGSNFGG